MTVDGRGQQLPPVGWFARILAWLRARPTLVLLGTLVAGLGVATAQTRYYRTKAARHQKAADIAAGSASRVANRTAENAARDGVQNASQDAQEAAGRDKSSGGEADAAAKDLDAIGTKWAGRKNPLIKAVLVALCAVAGTLPARATPCVPDADLAGLTAHLEGMATRLAGLDAEAARDAATSIGLYQRQRAALCAQLDARGDLVAALEAGQSERDKLIAAITADRDAGWKAWEGEIARRSVAPTLGRFGWTIGAGGCVDTDGDLSVCGAAVFGWRF
jgi:hypothetical protein